MRILIADDDPDICSILTIHFERFGEVVVVNNGRQAMIAALDALKAGTPFDLMSLDLNMPSFNGFQALSKIREVEKQLEIKEEDRLKVVVITAYEEEATRDKATDLEAQFVPKSRLNKRSIERVLIRFGLIEDPRTWGERTPAEILGKKEQEALQQQEKQEEEKTEGEVAVELKEDDS